MIHNNAETPNLIKCNDMALDAMYNLKNKRKCHMAKFEVEVDLSGVNAIV